MDSMLHLLSEIPIQCHQHVAQSRLAYCENVPEEGLISLHEVGQGTSALNHIPQTVQDSTQSSQPVGMAEACKLSHDISGVNDITNQTHYGHPSQYFSTPSQTRVTTSFGYSPDTQEQLILLSGLGSKNHGDTIGSH